MIVHTAYVEVGLLQAPSQGIQQSGLAGSRRAQQKSNATGTQHPAHIIQNTEVLLVWLYDAQQLQKALQSGTESAD